MTAAPLSIADALETCSFLSDSTPSFSPDGRFIAYTLRRDGVRNAEDPDERYHWFNRRGVSTFAGEGCDIFLTDRQTGRHQKLTGGIGTNWNPVFSPDGQRLAFYSDRDGMARLWVWERSTGKLRRASTSVVRPLLNREAPVWFPDSSRVLVKLLPEGESITSFAHRFLGPDSSARPTRADVLVYRAGRAASKKESIESIEKEARTAAEGRSLTNRARADLGIVDVVTGKTRFCAKGICPYDYRLTPDGRRVVFTHIGQVELNPVENRCDIVVADVAGSGWRTLTAAIPRTWWGTGTRLSPKGDSLAFLSFGEKETTVTFLPLTGKAASPRIARLPVADVDEAPLWTDNGASVFLIAGGAVWKIDALSGQSTELAPPPGVHLRQLIARAGHDDRVATDSSGGILVRFRREANKREGFAQIAGAAASPQKRSRIVWEDDVRLGRAVGLSPGPLVAFERQAADAPPDLWLLPTTGTTPKRQTQANPALSGRAFGKARLVEWVTARRDTARGALFLPPNFTPGRPVPLLVRVYAGASLSNLANAWGGWNGGADNAHLYTSRGIAVLLPDVPFRYTEAVTDIPGAVLPLLDKLISEGIADPGRLGLFGHSQGGYTALTLLTQTERFRCAAIVNGFGNLFGAYGQMRQDGEANDTAFRELRMGGTPWEKRDAYMANSPTFLLPQVRTPLLLIHGDADRSVQPFLANEIFVGLRRLEREVEYALYRGEGHVPDRWSAANRQDYAARILKWFTSRLLP